MLAWHGRIARRPVTAWVGSLIGDVTGLSEGGFRDDMGTAVCGVCNQAALAAFLARLPDRAQRFLDLQRQFVKMHPSLFSAAEAEAAIAQIVVNHIRMERASGDPSAAADMAGRALDTDELISWPLLLSDATGSLPETARADLKIELCKSLLAARRVDTGQRCEQIACAHDTAQVLRGVSAEAAVQHYLAVGNVKAVQRLRDAVAGDPAATSAVLMRMLENQISTGQQLLLFQIRSALLERVAVLGGTVHASIDHLFYMELVGSLFKLARMRDAECIVWSTLRRSARTARDLPFYWKASLMLHDVPAATDDKGAKRPLFPIYRSGMQALLDRFDLLDQRVVALAA